MVKQLGQVKIKANRSYISYLKKWQRSVGDVGRGRVTIELSEKCPQYVVFSGPYFPVFRCVTSIAAFLGGNKVYQIQWITKFNKKRKIRNASINHK